MDLSFGKCVKNTLMSLEKCDRIEVEMIMLGVGKDKRNRRGERRVR